MHQPQVSIIVPALNEEASIPKLVERIHSALCGANLSYEVIFINDRSTDGTADVIEEASHRYPVRGYLKQGANGKGTSIQEGFGYVNGDLVATIDADLQYPPEAIVDMVSQIHNDQADFVIANRDETNLNWIRRTFSVGFRFFFSRLLHNIPHDVQSGLKVFRAKLIREIDFSPSPWAWDLEFYLKARDAGYRISSTVIEFADRKFGNSKLRVLGATIEIGLHAIRMKFQRRGPVIIKPHKPEVMIGGGVAYRGKRFITHTTLELESSALKTFVFWQKALAVIVLGLFGIGFYLNPLATGITVMALLSIIYFSDTLFSLYLVIQSLANPPEFDFTDYQVSRLKDESLPTYTILCPLFREARVLPGFLRAIERIDWPKEKLDVILLLEENDSETILAAKALAVPSYVRVVVVPHSLPKTKPKACNYGLSIARGEYLVIYDAEDIPAPDQLKKAYLGFQSVPTDVKCLQAKLNYFNPGHNILTRLFTAEYSLWFDVILPGLQSINTSIPLGGTSNHFRTADLINLKGWDPFNVTEDCDLGVRLFKRGYKTAIINSVTLEEANSNLKNWIRQRSRWVKGYLQTYLVHMRNPVAFFKVSGIHALVFQLNVGGKIAFMLINPILWGATISYFSLKFLVGDFIESLYPIPILYIAGFSLIFGNFLHFFYYMIGAAKHGEWWLVKYVFLVPIYWFFMSVAAAMALYELIVRPHYWQKTHHGLNLAQSPVQSLSSMVVDEPKGEQTATFVPNPSPLLLGGETSRGLNILIFNWRDRKHIFAGGAEVYIHELAKQCVQDGHSVTIFCGNDGRLAKTEVIDGVKIIRRGGFYLVYLWAFLYYLFKFRGKFDVIVDGHNGVPFFTPLYTREPVLCLVHHVHQEVFRQYLPKPAALLARFLERDLMPLVYKNVRFITVSESSKRGLEDLGVAGAGVSIVTPGVDLGQLAAGRKSRTPTILYFGRLKAYKSIDTLLLAFRYIIEEVSSAKLTIAGSGDDEERLKRLAGKLGLSGSVDFQGRVSESEKIRLLQESWVMVNPSVMEGWGITTIEANACATPVVASDVPGLRDSVKAPQAGFLVEQGNYEAFAQAVLAILNNPVLRLEMSRNALSWARHFEWKKSGQKFIAVIRSLWRSTKHA